MLKSSLLALAAAGLVNAQAPPAPPGSAPAPPQPPPPPPVQQVQKPAAPVRQPHGVDGLHPEFTFGETTETKTTTEDWHDKMDKLKKEHVTDNKLLLAAGHHWTDGVWLYGDYRNNVENVHTAHECADECEKDGKCLHWCFELEKKRCDLRSEGGGLNEGAAHWITGHSKRWAKYEIELKKREGRNAEL